MAIACRYRGLALVVAVLAWAAIALQLVITVGKVTAGGGTLAWGLVVYFGYFTVLTNILAAVAVSWALFAPGTPMGELCLRPGIVTAVAVAISVVGIAYFLLLRESWDPQGWQLVADVLLHYVVPVLFVAYWWLAVPKESLRWRSLPWWLSYPVAYLTYMLVRGELTGLYPYPFADVTLLGYSRTLLNIGGVLVGYMALAALFVAAARSGDWP